MTGTLLLIELAGHVGLLLWGTHMVGTGVQRGFGRELRRWLGHNLDGRLHAFLTGLGITTLLQSSTNLEHVADILANGLVEFSLRSLKRGKRLSVEETAIVAAMHGDLVDCLRLALAVFLQGEPLDAQKLVASKARFREFEAAAMALSARSLRAAAASNRLTESETAERVAEESGLLLRSVRDLRRIHSHLASFAYPVLHRPGSRKSGSDRRLANADVIPTTAA